MSNGANVRARTAWMTACAMAVLATSQAATAQVAGPFDLAVIPASPVWSRDVTVPAGEWTLSFWASLDGKDGGTLAALAGKDGDTALVSVAVTGGKPVLTANGQAASGAALRGGGWHRFALVSTAKGLTLSVDGKPAATLAQPLNAQFARLLVGSAPASAAHIAGLRLDAGTYAATATPPNPALIQFAETSPRWPLQVRQMQGQVTPQPASTLPRGAARAIPNAYAIPP